jgi:hypothetical protein
MAIPLKPYTGGYDTDMRSLTTDSREFRKIEACELKDGRRTTTYRL